MNEKIENNIEEILNYIHNGIKNAGDFVVEQTPLLIQEILTYNLIFHGSLVGVGVFIIFVAICFSLYFIRKIDWKDDNHVIPFVIFNAFVWFVSLCLVFKNIFVVVKIYFAPRIYLLEYVSDLIK